MIDSFKKLLNELFYDWDNYSEPKLKNSLNSGFYTNKTSIYEKDGRCFLNYKTETTQINKKTYKTFIDFYEHLYYNDIEFQEVINYISDVWFEKGTVEISELGDTILLNSLLIKNDTKEICKNNQILKVSEQTMVKIDFFLNMIKK